MPLLENNFRVTCYWAQLCNEVYTNLFDLSERIHAVKDDTRNAVTGDSAHITFNFTFPLLVLTVGIIKLCSRGSKVM